MARLNMLDIANRSGNDATIGLIEEVLTVAPEFDVLPSRTKAGTTYRVGRRVALPQGAFRNVNEGVSPSKSTYVSEVKPMYFFDALLSVDEAIVKADEGEIGDILAQESAGIVQGNGIAMGRQIFLGKSADDKGFNGFETQITTDHEVDAQGTGTVETVWLAWLDPNYQGVHVVIGNDGEMDLKPWKQQYVPDPQNAAKQYLAWMSNLSFYVGLAMGSLHSLWRIINVNAAAPLTDELAAQLLVKVPRARRANLQWFMSRTAELGLRTSRYDVVTGLPFPPELDSLAGIPITITDTLSII